MVARAAVASTVFAAEWRSLGAPKRMLLAVSGGADSIALMRLAAGLEGADLRVASVDHGLRSASAEEARFVEREAAALGLKAVILRWDGDKPLSGVQAAARAARYRLLAQEAERWGADAILTAHTGDDQAETVLMRIRHRSGVCGLAGMARETFIADGARPPQRLLRPMLSMRRTGLRAFLKDHGAAFVDDPSNDDPRFERVRVRRALAAAPDSDEAAQALLALAADARRLASRLDRLDNARLAALEAEFLADGAVRLSVKILNAAIDGALAARLLGAVGGGEPPGEDAAAAALAAALGGRRATLAGALAARDGDDIVLMREPAAVLGRAGRPAAPPVMLAPGASLLWDRRFIVENKFSDAAEVRALGSAAQSLTPGRAERLGAAPGLWVKGRLAAFPGDDGPGETAIFSLAAERFHRLVVRH